MSEDDKAPTIFEAAADEEIQESHWCDRQRNAESYPFPPPSLLPTLTVVTVPKRE